MQILFKIKPSDPLEHILASGRYSRFWDENKAELIGSFYQHTGLKFKQRSITILINDGATNKAGNEHEPMRLSVEVTDPTEVAFTLIHELAHRLVVGNGIQPTEINNYAESRAPYHMHRHINLFLYDVLVDVLGKDAAVRYSEQELGNSQNLYVQAWKWAMAQSYQERQTALKNLIKRYRVNSK